MLNLRFILRVFLTFIKRFKFIIFAGVFAGAVFFLILKYISPILFAGSKEKIGITGKYTPSNLPPEVVGLISGGLTKLDAEGNPEPFLAESWETPDKGKTWVFKLNKDITWHDGEKIKSTDIRYQFSDLAEETPDPDTIIFKLQNPYAALPVIVSKPVFKKGLLGVGEYKVKKIKLSGGFIQNMTLENDAGNIKIIKFYPMEERTKLAYKLGEVDIIKNIINPEPFDSWHGSKVEGDVVPGEHVVIFFNTSVSPLSEKNLRQALSYAIDKEALGRFRSVSPVSESSWAFNPQVKPYDYDAERAKKLVSELPKEVKEELKIILTASPVLLPQAEKIVKNWQDAGVPAEVRIQPTIPQDFQAMLVIFDIPDDPDQYSLWHSTQMSTNISKYQDPRIDKLLEDGRAVVDREERRKIYLDFQRYLAEDAPAVFLYHPINYTVTRN